MVLSTAKQCIKDSLQEFIESLEEFYSVLPVPYLDARTAQKLNPVALEKRKMYREKLEMEPEKVRF